MRTNRSTNIDAEGAAGGNPSGQSCQLPFSAGEDSASEREDVEAEKEREVAAENESAPVELMLSKQDATSV